ncbi:N-acetylneuraminate synthase [Algoriphagus sanaruensis]|uniref:N-acetylneuraminate synthase n=1 Tax=Algoriphagus sanaruensis TaxID=1727163 RepID=A0A142EQX3_9BACT|nr:N-acetylneuraminate synthase [Algoriphagus sanaruensis]AMQ57528.1 N-acetylneuraminate synthase [Algoriphagus sanaruensis]
MSSKHVMVIAEAGVNHNGDIIKALELIDVAAEAGADFVKFQTFKAEKIVNPTAQKAVYQRNNMKDDEDTQFGMLKKLEMGEDWYPILIGRCKEKGINFLSTGFDSESIDFLNTLEIPFYKIPSGEITNKPYLQHIARKGKDIILSTGMATLNEVKAAMDAIIQEGIKKERITVLHCNTEYPTPMEDVNLLAMNLMANELGVKVGYSDHTLGIEVPVAAVALGACVIEKHFTLDRNLPGPDHAASLEPEELKAMVQGIRNIEKAIAGSGIKEPSPSEKKNIAIARKSLHLNRDLKKGEVISKDYLIALRPGDGISPMEIDEVLGKELLFDLKKGSKLLIEHLR